MARVATNTKTLMEQRIFLALTILQKRRQTIGSLANQLCCDKRTVYRLVHRINDLGFQIDRQRDFVALRDDVLPDFIVNIINKKLGRTQMKAA
jgi:predicted DNA-binding transcriptional regulator YafY